MLDFPGKPLSGQNIETLRQALNAFHTYQSHKSGSWSWIDSAEAIIASEVTDLAFDDETSDDLVGEYPIAKLDSAWPVKGEALRRFAKRISYLPQSVDVVCAMVSFLRNEGFLTDVDLENAPPHYATCAIAKLFCAQCKQSNDEICLSFEGVYLATAENDEGISEVLLSLSTAPGGEHIQVRETSLFYRKRPTELRSLLLNRKQRLEFDRCLARSGSGVFGCHKSLSLVLHPGDLDTGVFILRLTKYGSSNKVNERPKVASFCLVGDHPLADETDIAFTRVIESEQVTRMRRIKQAISKTLR